MAAHSKSLGDLVLEALEAPSSVAYQEPLVALRTALEPAIRQMNQEIGRLQRDLKQVHCNNSQNIVVVTAWGVARCNNVVVVDAAVTCALSCSSQSTALGDGASTVFDMLNQLCSLCIVAV